MNIKLKAGTTLFRHGEASRFAYRILAGEAEVTHELDGAPRPIGIAKAGELVGEIGALVGCPRNATVRFTTDAEVERFDRNALIRLLAKDPDLGKRMLHALSLRTRVLVDRVAEAESQKLTQPVKALRSFPFRAAPVALARACIFRVVSGLRKAFKRFPGRRKDEAEPARMVFSAGDLLFKEGEPSREVFRIRSGVVECTKNVGSHRHLLGRLRAGDFLGEMGVLETRSRNATARAIGRVEVDLLSPEAFFTLMTESRGDYYRVVDALCERAYNLTLVLGEDAATRGNALDQLVGSFESLTELAEERVVADMQRFRRFMATQVDHGKEMVDVYQKFLKGDATSEELERANGHFRDYLKLAGLGTLMVLPGAVLTIPIAVKLGKAVGVDILPSAPTDDKEP